MAFYKNNPFCPHTGRDNGFDQRLRKEFKNRFLEASEEILGRSNPEASLSVLWVDMIEERG